MNFEELESLVRRIDIYGEQPEAYVAKKLQEALIVLKTIQMICRDNRPGDSADHADALRDIAFLLGEEE